MLSRCTHRVGVLELGVACSAGAHAAKERFGWCANGRGAPKLVLIRVACGQTSWAHFGTQPQEKH